MKTIIRPVNRSVILKRLKIVFESIIQICLGIKRGRVLKVFESMSSIHEQMVEEPRNIFVCHVQSSDAKFPLMLCPLAQQQWVSGGTEINDV